MKSILVFLRLFFSKKGLAELVVIFQISMMTAFAVGNLKPLEKYMVELMGIEKLYQWNQSKAYYINPGEAVQEAIMFHQDIGQSNWQSKLKTLNHVKDVGGCFYAVGSYPMQNSVLKSDLLANVFIHTENIANYTRLVLLEGTAGVVVSERMKEMYPIGSQIEIELIEYEITETFTVTGILKEGAVIPTIQSHGSESELEVFAAFTKNYPDASFVVVYDDEFFKKVSAFANYWVVTDQASEVMKTDISKTISNLGIIRSVSEAFDEAMETILRHNSYRMFAFILFTLIAGFGFGTYESLMIQKKQVEFSIFRINGMTKRTLRVLMFAGNAILMMIGIIIGWFLEPSIMQLVTHQEQSRAGVLSLLIAAAILFGVLLISQTWSISRINRMSVISAMEGGIESAHST